MSTSPPADRPVLRIVGGGEPTAEELAALVVALASAQPAGSDEELPSGSPWADREQMLRRPLPHGPGAWRRSGYWAGA